MDKIKHFLNQNKISYRLITYSQKVKNAQEASVLIGLPIRQIVKSLIFKTDNYFLLFLLPSEKRLNTISIEKQLGTKIKLATPDEVLEVSGYSVGMVSPLLIKNQIKIYIDLSLLKFQKIGIGSGKNGIEVVLNPNDLKNILNATAINLL